MDTVRKRDALQPRREPYWQSLGAGRFVGFRRSAEGGSWLARAYDPGTRKQSHNALTEVAKLPASEQYAAAVRAARAWFDHLDVGGASEVITVRRACELYVEHIRSKKGDRAAEDAIGRFRRHVDGDPVANIELPKLTSRHVAAWRERLKAKPATMPKRGKRCRVKTEQPVRPRSESSINRDLVALRAALNLALHDSYVTTDAAWRAKLEATPGADRRRDLTLDRDQRRALIAALPADLAAFARGLSLLPLRPGALASLTVADYDARHGSLRIGKDKAGKGRKIHLPEQTAQLLREHAWDKLPAAPLFSRHDGGAWDKDRWKKPLKAAAVAAGLPPETTAYTLRHSVITDLVTGVTAEESKRTGRPEQAGLDLFTVAALSGTSVAMIERHYGHLQAERSRAALARLVL